MRIVVLTAALVLGPGLADAACPPDLLGRLLDQGYSKDEVVRLCGGGSAGEAGAGGQTRTAAALARLQQLTDELGGRCRAAPTRTPRGDGSCDLYDQYRGILADWQARQSECSGGDETACRHLDTAAAKLLSTVP